MKAKLILLFWMFNVSLNGQTIYLSGRTNANNKHGYSKVIGENKFGVYILKFRDYNLEKDFVLERFSPDLGFLESQSYKLDRKERVLKFVLADSHIHCLTETKKTIKHYKIDYSLQELKQAFKPHTLPKGKSMFDEPEVVYSHSKKRIAITIPYGGPRNIQHYEVITRNLNAKSEESFTIKTPFNYKDCKLESTLITPNGKYSFLYSNESRERRKVKNDFYWITPTKTPNNSKHHLINSYKYLISAKIHFHPQTQEASIIALFNFETKGSSQGVSIYNEKFPTESFNNPFQDKVIMSVQGASALGKGRSIDDLFIRFAMPHANGSFLLSLEKYYVSKELESFYTNGIPQSSTRSIYNYEDVILIQFDSTNRVDWSNIVHKKQSSMGSSTYYSSYLFITSNQEVCIIFNEKGNIENRLLMHRFSKNGQQKVQVLVEPSNDLMQGIPIEGKQVSYNSFVLPILNGRSQNLMKVVL